MGKSSITFKFRNKSFSLWVVSFAIENRWSAVLAAAREEHFKMHCKHFQQSTVEKALKNHPSYVSQVTALYSRLINSRVKIYLQDISMGRGGGVGESTLMLYLFNQMTLPFYFSSAMFVQKSFKFSTTVISFSYDIRSAF